MLAILLTSLLLSPRASAFEGCGATPENLQTLLEVAEDVVNACEENLAEKHLLAYNKEVKVLNDYIAHLEPQIKKVAVSSNKVIINCGVETLRKMETVLECRRLSALQRATEARLDRLQKWKESFTEKLNSDASTDLTNAGPPCASSTEFSNLATIREFNSALYSSWEECRK